MGAWGPSIWRVRALGPTCVWSGRTLHGCSWECKQNKQGWCVIDGQALAAFNFLSFIYHQKKQTPTVQFSLARTRHARWWLAPLGPPPTQLSLFWCCKDHHKGNGLGREDIVHIIICFRTGVTFNWMVFNYYYSYRYLCALQCSAVIYYCFLILNTCSLILLIDVIWVRLPNVYTDANGLYVCNTCLIKILRFRLGHLTSLPFSSFSLMVGIALCVYIYKSMFQKQKGLI